MGTGIDPGTAALPGGTLEQLAANEWQGDFAAYVSSLDKVMMARPPRVKFQASRLEPGEGAPRVNHWPRHGHLSTISR